MIEGPTNVIRLRLLNSTAFLVEVETKLPTKRKVQAWWRLGLRAPLVAGRNYSLIKYIFFLTLDRTIGSRFDKWGGRQFYTKYDLLAKDFFRLACVSIETHNLQRVLRSGFSPLYRLYGYVQRRKVWFSAVLVWKRVSVSTILVWNRVWFVHSSLELGMFFRRISYFFIIWR